MRLWSSFRRLPKPAIIANSWETTNIFGNGLVYWNSRSILSTSIAVRYHKFRSADSYSWQRAWIVQEVLLAPQVTVYCGGTQTVDFKDLRDALALFSQGLSALQPRLNEYLKDLHPQRDHWALHPDFEIDQVAAMRLVDISSDLFSETSTGGLVKKSSLETLLCLLAGYESTDPRDTVYALLSLAKDQCLPAPNYAYSLFEVYRESVQYLV